MTDGEPLCPVRTVATVVPYHGLDERTGRWLGECLDALLRQAEPLQAIVVVDDASPHPPGPLAQRFPTVTFLRNDRNTGPFAILDRAFATLPVDALLLNDADDLSTPDRLATLRAAMHACDADIVGSQWRPLLEDVPEGPVVDHARMPADPRGALLEKPTAHTLLLCASLVRCGLARRIGGFSTALRFGADSEFVRRAVFAGVVRNVDDTCYVRRIHARSLTRAPATGFGSAARLAVQQPLQAQARALAQAWRDGAAPDLRPLWRAEAPARLRHVAGPRVPELHED